MNKEKKIVSIFRKSALQYSKMGQCLERNYLSLKGKKSAKQDFLKDIYVFGLQEVCHMFCLAVG